MWLIIHSDSSRMGGVSAAFMCLFVCLSVFPHDISKPDASRITKLDIEMFHHESWKTRLFWGQEVRVARHKKHCRLESWLSCECWLLVKEMCFAADFL